MFVLRSKILRLCCALALATLYWPSGANSDGVPPSATVAVDFSQRSDPPLLKKVAQFNSGLTPIPNYERDIARFDEIYADSLRVDLGIGSRRFFPVDAVQGPPDHLKYDFSLLDRWVELLSRRNVLPYPSWCYIPVPLQKDGNSKTLNTDLPNWREIWKGMHREIARHFREGGMKIGYHEMYNEPDLRNNVFLNTAQFNAGVYLEMYKYASLGTKEGDPDAMIGGPAYADGNLTMPFVEFVTRENLPLDFLSFHTYLQDSWPVSYQSARNALASSPRYKQTEIHLNEINWLNGRFPDRGRPTSPNNKYEAAARTLDVIADIVGKTDITMAHWAQFMESTAGDDSYGIIRKDGHRKAAFHAFKIYSDMPEERVTATSREGAVKALASTDGRRAAVAIWNNDDTERTIDLKLSRLPFSARQMRLYRVDRTHASYFDGAPEDLEAEILTAGFASGGFTWRGQLPGRATLYFVADNGLGARDFQPGTRDVRMGSVVRTHHAFEYESPEPKTSYRFFDRRSWTAYLGMGSEKTADASCGVTVEKLPPLVNISAQTTGKIQKQANAGFGVRVDYAVRDKFVKSVFFHGGIQTPQPAPWGTLRPPDQMAKVNLERFQLRLADYAPKGWSEGDRVLLSFRMQNTGPGSRAEVKVRPEKR